MPTVSAKFYEFGEFRLDADEKILWRADSVVDATPKALEILLVLVENAGRIVPKEEIFARVWENSFVEEANLSHHIFRLRKALGEDKGHKFIETVPRRGYRLVAEVNAPDPGPAVKPKNEPTYDKGRSVAENGRVGLVFGTLVLLLAAAGFGFWFYGDRRAGGEQINSIAVMPFVNETSNADIEYLSDGMTETLIRNLSELPRLNIKARSSVFRYKGKEVSTETIGNELKVQAILNGRLVQRGDELTLYLSLIDTKTENQIWGEQYNRKLSNLIGLQTEIARDVSNKLRLKLSGADEQRMSKKQTTDPEAYQLYLKGRYYWNKRTIADIRKSVGYFNQAIEKDPSYALAYAGLADAYLLIPAYATLESPHDFFPKSKAAAMKALEIDEMVAEAHAALGAVKDNYDWNFAEAEKDYRRAIELNPNYAIVRQWYAESLMSMGRREESHAEMKKAQELDPLSLIINSMLGSSYRIMGQYDAAVEQLKKTIEIEPNFPRAHLFLAETYESKGMFEEAVIEYERHAVMLGTPPDEAAEDWAGVREAYKTGGANSFFRRQLEIYERGRAQKLNIAPPLVVIAGVYVKLGENEKALKLLEKSLEQRDAILYRLRTPEFDPLRSDPRFLDLLRRAGVEK